MRPITQDDIDAAGAPVAREGTAASAAARAYEAICAVGGACGRYDLMRRRRPTTGGERNAEQTAAMERSLGTGVVIVDNGTILTNLHVVMGAKPGPRALPQRA